jgi:hypothetical protein
MEHEVYQKEGRQIRYEQIRHERGRLVRVSERGEALLGGETFAAQPLGGELMLPELDDGEVLRAVGEIRGLVPTPLRIERLIVSEGVAGHALKLPGRGRAEEGCPPLWDRWTERSRRLHLAIASDRLRILIDRGDFDLESLGTLIDALGRAGAERSAPGRLRLAPPVAAALLPSLIGVAPPNVRLCQTAGGRDGRGNPIEEQTLAEPPWPNWYRPSYRSRPLRAPLNVRAECSVQSIDRDLPVALALLAPVDGLTLRLLCLDGGASFPVTVHLSRIDAVAAEREWYPYAAGAWGSEMML